ncbi:uncharacterized protein TNCV_3000761 [Trichonephila clavipes]|nr:uncharacterized protein TNCV_3000761 [Trichonephila clavipes]
MMETVGMVRIFQRSLSHRSVRYTSYIGDGDSKTFSSITASNPYGEDITVSKIECVGHVQKRMGTRLRKLKQMSSKLSDGKSIGGKGRLTDRMIDLITTYYGNAIRQNKTCLSDMRKAVWAVYFHIRSSDEEPLHSFCPVGPNSWCKYQNQVVEGSVETFRHSNKLPVAELWFQQDGATCHTARATIDLLKDTFGDRLISRFGPVNWPPRSCDLTPLDNFLWGYVKSLVYANKPQTLDYLEDNIRRVIADIRPQMSEKVIENWTSRLDYIRASRGSHMPEIIFKM